MKNLSAKQIRMIRIANGVSQKDFAELIGVPQGTWSNVELGNQPLYAEIQAKAVLQLSELGCDFSILKQNVDFPKYTRILANGKITNVTNDKEESVNTEEPVVTLQDMKDRLFDYIAEEIADTLKRKNHDYGDSFHDVYEQFGDVSTYIRLSDKLGRLATLVKGIEEQVKDEPIEDVLKDMAGYCILTLASKERLKNKQQGE